jgi:hypothetical protein
VLKRDMIFTAIFRVRVVVSKAIAVARVAGAIQRPVGFGKFVLVLVLVLVHDLLVVGTKPGVGWLRTDRWV